MKAMFLTETGHMEPVETDKPEPGEGEVLLEMGAVGICGSDVHYYKNGRIGEDHALFPQGLGHEPSGIIVQTGKGVDPSREGERVAVEPGIGCGTCEFCESARANLCPDIVFLASPGVQGAYKEYMVMPAVNCFNVGDSISLGEAAMFEPFGVGVEAASIAGIQPGDSACVLGCGSIGLCTMAAARMLGVADIYAADPLEWRREAAEQDFGADHVCDPDTTDIREWLMDLTGGRGTDIVFEASGDHDAFTLTADLAVRGGAVIIIGIPETDMYTFNAHTARRKALSFINCRRFNRKLPAAIRFAEQGRIDLSRLITHEFALEDTAEGFELVHGYRDGVIKAVVNIH